MTHLSPTEIVDAVEGTLDAPRASHLATCAHCREQTDALRITLTHAGGVDVPEPSPLFWEHFSDRVRQAVNESPASLRSWWRHPAMGFASAAVAAAIVVIALRTPHPIRPAVSPVGSAAPSTAAPAAPDAIDSTPHAIPSAQDAASNPGSNPASNPASNDDAWMLLRAAASDMELSDAHAAGLNVRPGSVESAVLDLTPVERTELERLLREELKHPSD